MQICAAVSVDSDVNEAIREVWLHVANHLSVTVGVSEL